MQLTNYAIPSLLAYIASADIQSTGPWTNKDWVDLSQKLRVSHGLISSWDEDVQRRITAPRPLDGDVSDYETKANVITVKSILTEAQWEHLFPYRDEVYTYDGFLNAVGKFPAFCSQNNRKDEWSDVDMCKKELATVFAHFVQETSFNSLWHANNHEFVDMYRQGLYYIERVGCEGEDSINISSCNWHDHGWSNNADAWPIQDGEQYYARGPFQLAWNYNYGRFSNVFYEDDYYSRLTLLEYPERVHEDPFTVFSAALWFYMTPQSPKPSMHDVATGYFEPNSEDEDAGIMGGFGTTINIINGADECGFPSVSANNRVAWYEDFLEYFGISDDEDLYCEDEGDFPAGGAASVPSYYEQNWSVEGACQVVWWQTPYSVYAKEDYKRCVCEKWGNGEASCPQES